MKTSHTSIRDEAPNKASNVESVARPSVLASHLEQYNAHFSVFDLHNEVSAEIESMVLFQLSEGGPVPTEAVDVLERMKTETLSLGDLILAHAALAQMCRPAKPRAIRALQEDLRSGGASKILGPTPIVRRLTLVSIFFAVLFFATSLSPEINVETVTASIYNLSGTPLAIKLLLLTSAAGLGASFAVLFDIWRDLSSNRYDPLAESANWMRIGLGIAAGLILAEIISGERDIVRGGTIGTDPSLPMISDPLLALIGGFSATVLHMVLVSVVEAFRRAFSSPEQRSLSDPTLRAASMWPAAKIQLKDPAGSQDILRSAPPSMAEKGPTRMPERASATTHSPDIANE